MATQPVRLKALIRERHWQKYSTFVREFQKAARSIDPSLIAACPSRAQLHRWMSGQLKGLPYPDACQVLEKMFSNWTADQMFQPAESELAEPTPSSSATADIAEKVSAGVDHSAPVHIEWGFTDRIPRSSRKARSLDDLGPDDMSEPARLISKSLVELATVRRMSEKETTQLASLAGNVVELDLHIDMDIEPDGWAVVRYRQELLNMSDRPLTRISREVWFENTDGPLSIEPTEENERRVAIQRTHDTAHSAKFACQISPALQPGERTVIGYACKGGQFVADHYWRQSMARYTRHFTLRLRHRGMGMLRTCSAIEEHPDGSENSAAEDLIWDVADGDVLITLARNHLHPTQAMTLRWDVPHDNT